MNICTLTQAGCLHRTDSETGFKVATCTGFPAGLEILAHTAVVSGPFALGGCWSGLPAADRQHVRPCWAPAAVARATGQQPHAPGDTAEHCTKQLHHQFCA